MKQKQKICNYLVRSKFIENNKENGIILNKTLENDLDFKFALLETFVHHSKKFIKSSSVEQFCELFEVMTTIAETFGYDINEIDNILKDKLDKEGDYKARLYIEKIIKNNK